jgi:nicotinamidase-related amidase
MSSSVFLGSSARNRWQVSAQRCDLVRPALEAQVLELPARPQALRFDLARTAMVVIDMQNDFCHPQGWLASIGVDVTPLQAPVAPLQALLPALRARGVPVLWVNWGNRPDLLNASPCLLHVYNGSGQGTGLGDVLASAPRPGSRVLQKDHWGAALVEPLSLEPTDILVDKYRMSGFWDTPLESILRNLRVDTLLFAGVNADQCVLATLMDANFLGYDTLLLEDCTATSSPSFCLEATLYNVRQCFGFTLQSTDLLKEIQ